MKNMLKIIITRTLVALLLKLLSKYVDIHHDKYTTQWQS